MTYAALNERANQLAHELIQAYEAGPEQVIGIAMPRSLEVVIAILAVHKTGPPIYRLTLITPKIV